MATTVNRQQNYITTVRQQSEIFWKAYQFLLSAQLEWTAQDYTNTLDDGTGANDGISAVMVGAVVNTSANAIKTVMDAGNSTNITSLLE